MPFTLSASPLPDLPELLSLYGSVGWTSYTRDPQVLARAVRHSGYVWTARDGAGALIGLARGVTDDVSILYVQDLSFVRSGSTGAWAEP